MGCDGDASERFSVSFWSEGRGKPHNRRPLAIATGRIPLRPAFGCRQQSRAALRIARDNSVPSSDFRRTTGVLRRFCFWEWGESGHRRRMRAYRPDPAPIVSGGQGARCCGLAVSDGRLQVCVTPGAAAGQGLGQGGRLRLCRWAVTDSLGPDNVVPAGRHSRLPVRSSRDRLESALRSGIGPVSWL